MKEMLQNHTGKLYHQVPKDMKGETLHPLNVLKDIHPEVYEEHLKEYENRPHILEKTIPTLGDIKWNDVIHFSPVHPEDVKNALFANGRTQPFEGEFFEVDPEILDANNTTVYLGENNFTPYDPSEINTHNKIPKETIKYYTDMHEQGLTPKRFHGIPHILHKGSLDVSKFKKFKI